MSYYDLTIGHIPVDLWLAPAPFGELTKAVEAEADKRKRAACRGTGFLLSVTDNGESGEGLFLELAYDETREGDQLLWLRIPDASIDTLCEALEAARRLRRVEGQ